MHVREALFFFNFQDVTAKGDICQMVTEASIKKEENSSERSMKSNEEHDTRRMMKHQNYIVGMGKYIDS
jgi:hypothetical protein